jgi:hypothetical protein
MALSKTAALKVANEAVGQIHRQSRTSYWLIAPYYDDKPNGPGTELRADSYPKAQGMRTRAVCRVALALMDRPDNEYAIENAFDRGHQDVKSIMSEVLK